MHPLPTPQQCSENWNLAEQSQVLKSAGSTLLPISHSNANISVLIKAKKLINAQSCHDEDTIHIKNI